MQLDNAELGTVNSHAANKARIQAELENEEQARKHAQNVVRLAATDQLNSEIITNRTRGTLLLALSLAVQQVGIRIANIIC